MKRRSGDILAEIKAAVDLTAFDLATAEGRADFDDTLRALIVLKAGTDTALRRHAADMIQDWRRELFGWKR
jgi:hypothetical protein